MHELSSLLTPFPSLVSCGTICLILFYFSMAWNLSRRGYQNNLTTKKTLQILGALLLPSQHFSMQHSGSFYFSLECFVALGLSPLLKRERNKKKVPLKTHLERRAEHRGQERLLNGTRWCSVCTVAAGDPAGTWAGPLMGETATADHCAGPEVLHMASVGTLSVAIPSHSLSHRLWTSNAFHHLWQRKGSLIILTTFLMVNRVRALDSRGWNKQRNSEMDKPNTILTMKLCR